MPRHPRSRDIVQTEHNTVSVIKSIQDSAVAKTPILLPNNSQKFQKIVITSDTTYLMIIKSESTEKSSKQKIELPIIVINPKDTIPVFKKDSLATRTSRKIRH